MKKTYEPPKAEKYVFDYVENVVASGFNYEQYENDKNYPNLNPCYTNNTSDLHVPFTTTCIENATPKE